MNRILKVSSLCLVFELCFAVFVSAAKPPITAVAFAPDGKSVVAVSQSGLQQFKWPGLQSQRKIQTKSSNLHCVTFAPDGKFVAVGGGDPSESGSVELFLWPSGKPLRQLSTHDDSVRSIVWIDESKLFSASIDRTIKLWELVSSESNT
ncbi:MAG: hypothetical protein CMJ78_19130, partial [Planctomycetaceae bacterium]|nr:hypothetical protein [Planctomycetaceae bacterium]